MDKPYIFRFTRRKYGDITYTWAFVRVGLEKWESLGDPWPCVSPSVTQLYEAADAVLARLAAKKETTP